MQRQFDSITGSLTKVEELYVLKNFPVNMLTEYESSVTTDAVFDMRFGIFHDSGVIQLTELVPEELLYINAHSNAMGSLWKRQHCALAAMVRKYSPEKVLEIGGGTGILERIYNQTVSKKTKRWVIIDPTPNPLDTDAEFIEGFFPEALPKNYNFDMLVHSHTWEHAYSPKEFLKSIANILPENARMVFSVPNLRYLLENAMTSILNFEHTVYLSDKYVEWLLNEFNFQIETKYYFENHSVMYSVVKKNSRLRESVDISKEYDMNKRLFMDYIYKHKKRIAIINERIQKAKAPIFLFGAHITTQFYLAFGLETDNIIGILDNDRFKWDKRVCGTEWRVTSPDILKKYDSPSVILPAGPYTEEIKSQILKEINYNTRIIEVGGGGIRCSR